MGVRWFCDQCGSTVTGGLNRYIVQKDSILPPNQAYTGYSPNMPPGVAGAMLQAQMQKVSQAVHSHTMSPFAMSHSVELCDRCEVTWIERVKKLTEASNGN